MLHRLCFYLYLLSALIATDISENKETIPNVKLKDINKKKDSTFRSN